MVKTATVQLPLAQLIEDLDLYPRHNVDSGHVGAIADALKTGVKFPPIVADKKSKRITDGWHRNRAYLKILTPETKVPVELVDYKDEATMLLDAVARNASHGRKFDSIDRTRCVIMLRSRGLDDVLIGQAMNIPEERVEKLAIRIATSGSAKEAVPGTDKITLKRSVKHLDGQVLTKQQSEVHASLPGTSFQLLAKQIRLGLESKMCDLTDSNMLKEFKKLRDALNKVV